MGEDKGAFQTVVGWYYEIKYAPRREARHSTELGKLAQP